MTEVMQNEEAITPPLTLPMDLSMMDEEEEAEGDALVDEVLGTYILSMHVLGLWS